MENPWCQARALEVDFLTPRTNGAVAFVECKAARTVTPAMAAPMQRLAEALKKKRPRAIRVEMFLVHPKPENADRNPGSGCRGPCLGVAGFRPSTVTRTMKRATLKMRLGG